MHKKKLIVDPLHNSLPSRSRPVEPKAELSTFFGIGNEEIRKSIEALDRMLDQYDGDGGPGQASSNSPSTASSEKKFAPRKVDPAAHMLASCMKSAGGHKLRKSSAGSSGHDEDLPLPPPPPELLQRIASWTGTLPSNQQHSLGCAVPKCRAAPVVPKRDPETKLSSSSLSDAAAFNCQCERDGTSCESGNSHFLNYGQKRHPESGYITPDQETVDSMFLSCLEKPGTLKMSQPGIQHTMPSSDREVDSIKKNVLPEIPFPRPPAEFGDIQVSPSPGWQHPLESSRSSDRFLRNCNFSASNISVQLGNSGDLFINPNISSAVLNQSCTSVQNGQQSVAWRRPSAESGSRKDSMQSISFSMSGAATTEPVSSVLPYLACIVPPPPPMEKFTEDRPMSSRSVISTIGIVPPPPPMHSIHPSEPPPPPPPPPSFPTALFPDVVQSAGFGDLPSPTRLPPPPTLPKQPKKSLQSLDSSVAAESPLSGALPFKVNLRPVTPSKNPAHPPAVESNGSAVNTVPFHSDLKRSVPTAINSVAGSAGRSYALQDEVQFNTVSVSQLCQKQDLGNTLNFVTPPPPPPPPPLSVDQNIFGRCSKTQQPSLPVAAPVVPTKSWTASQPPPPVPVAEFKPDVLEGSPSVSSLKSALQSVRLQSTAGAANEKSVFNTSSGSSLGGREALISQIQTGIQLRKSANSARIRQTSPSDLVDVTNRSPDISCSFVGENLDGGGQLFKASDNISEKLVGQEMMQHQHSELPIDVTKLPAYQEIPENCPTWKRALIEKKNKQLEEDAMREILMKKQDEERWRDIPEWKRSLIIEKEKKKLEELAPYQAERKRQEGEMEWLQSLPEWKRNLIIKKRGDYA